MLTLFLGIVFSQRYSFENQKKVFEILEDNPLFVPNAKILKQVTFGFDNLMTDVIWLRIVQYVGGNARSSNYELLGEYLESVTELDPKFYMPYFVAQLLLPEVQHAEKAISISEKGLKSLPERWEIPFYMGYIYYYYLEDYEKGAEMYEKASQIPGVLSSAKRMAINLTSKANKHSIALSMWIEAYENEENANVKDLIAQKIIREKNYVDLEEAVKKYVEIYNTYPQSLEELIQVGLISEIPLDPIENWKRYTIQNNVIILQ